MSRYTRSTYYLNVMRTHSLAESIELVMLPVIDATCFGVREVYEF